MDITTLCKIFSKTFEDASWLEVLKSVFGAKLGLRSQPLDITSNLKTKDLDTANAAFELGSFTTTDDRIIGLYKIEVKPEVWLGRNKVSLRELLRNIYKNDVDGAIIVFVQQDKWRLSFVSEIKVLNDEGEIVEQATETKRYTYLLGEGEKVRTPSERLCKLSGKSLALQDILNAFSVEALNEEFYKIIQDFFYELVGGKVGKGKKVADYGKGILQLPSLPKENRQIHQEFTVRLIGRTIFCWFLKMKKSDNGTPLLPESLLSQKAVKNSKSQHENYYHNILERLFFQTLNTPMEQRVENLPEGTEQIPFLNGGLFEPGIQDYYKPSNVTGLNENLNTLTIDDQWFINFFEELEKYNFTIDENSVTDVEVSIDPEMLGRIFENLLAEIDPDSGETARKATGSFYTPREIVDYMATDSLVQYIHNKTNLPQDKIRPIFKMMDKQELDFSKAEIEDILDALEQVKILDPACGSGAFPMGVLQKIVQALQKLDPVAKWWIERQVNYNTHPTARQAVREKLQHNPEYARKIGVIQNSLYGVDIQPIAAEISKLRCFLTLIVDENINENSANRGIEPLPNLEFKFVTADTLIKLPEERDFGGLFHANDDLAKLETIRQEYLQSYGEQKIKLKEQFKSIQDKIAKQQIGLGQNIDVNSRAYQLSTWNPFGHEKSDWFDTKWMFGVEEFDVVIGNPPYGGTISNSLKKANYYSETSFGGKESYKFFFNRCLKLFSNNHSGVICFITSDSYIEKENFEDLRIFILKKVSNIKIIALGDNVFNNVNLPTSISLLNLNSVQNENKIEYLNLSNFTSNKEKVDQAILGKYISVKPLRDQKKRFAKVDSFTFDVETKPLIKLYDQVMGVKVYQIGKGKPLQSSYEIENDVFVSEDPSQEDNWMRFIDSGVKRYHYEGSKKYINYGQWLAEPRNPKYFTNPKIIMREVVNPTPFSCYFEDAAVVKNTNAVIIEKSNEYPLLFLLPILNSKIFAKYLLIESPKSSNKSFPSITSKLLKSFPIPICSESAKKSFMKITAHVNSLFSFKSNINLHVPNSHITQLFEEVIDAMVMELYFKEDFEKSGIEFIKYSERDFEPIEEKSEPEQIEIIHSAYQKLREKDNEIRNNLKLMDIKLADIVMPIKAAK